VYLITQKLKNLRQHIFSLGKKMSRKHPDLAGSIINMPSGSGSERNIYESATMLKNSFVDPE
jgi:hypothetical protein